MKRKFKGYIIVLLGLLALFFSVYWTLFEVGVSSENLKIQYLYFTNQTTLVSGLYMIFLGFYYCGIDKLRRLVFHPALKSAIMAYVSIVCIGYYVGVVPFSLFTAEELYLLAPQSIFMHAINPIIVLYLYMTTPFYCKKIDINVKSLFYSLIYILRYFSFVAAQAIIAGLYVYPFLDPLVMGGIKNVIFASLGVFIIGVFLVGAFLRHGQKRAVLLSDSLHVANPA